MREELLGCLEDQALLAGAEGRHDTAVRLAAMVGASRERLGLAGSGRSERRWRANLAALRETLGGARFDAAWREGKDWQVDEAIRSAQAVRTEPAAAVVD